MKLASNIYFYEGDYLKKSKFLYRGIGSSNFLVVTGREQVMIDSGIAAGPHKARLIGQMKNDGVEIKNTSHVIMSHTHPDHVLFAKKLSKRQALDFWLHEDSEPMTRRGSFQFEAHFNYPGFILREIFEWPVWVARIAMWRYLGFDYLKINRMIRDGEKLNFGVEMVAVSIPAHFPGHIGIYFPKQKIMYSADLFDFRVAHGGIINNAMSSYEQLFADIKRLRSLQIETLVPGHGSVINGKSNVKRVLDRIEESTRNYLKDIINVLRQGNRERLTLTDITNRIFTDSIAYNEAARKIIVYNSLMHLKKMNEVSYSIADGRAIWYLTS